MIPVAFYAPMKAPDDPVPSGDRTVARLILAALERAGFAPGLASRLRARDPEGVGHPALREAGLAQADGLVARWRDRPRDAPDRPRLWFTYHVYYKAPDWIGPRVAAALGIPYVVAEGSRAGARAGGRTGGPHAVGRGGAEAALDAAALVLAMSAVDREGLERARPPGQRILDLPPFLDLDAWDPGAWDLGGRPARRPDGRPPRLLAVGMMRAGDKLASYRVLADALGGLAARPWTLDLVGDGPARAEVEAAFAGFAPGRVRAHGALERGALGALYAAGDLLVWPAVGEAFGMALLEAQAHGLPAVAGASGGVPEIVIHGRTGLLAPPGDAAAFATAVAALLDDPARRRAMGAAAGERARAERGLDRAAERLRAALLPLLEPRPEQGLRPA